MWVYMIAIESLHVELCGEVLARIERDSPIDFVNTLCSCKDMLQSPDKEVFHTLNLAPLVKKPLLSNKYTKLMDNYLARSNLEAHYVKCIVSYFHQNTAADDMHHFSIAANGNHKEAVYLYEILLLRNDQIDEGKNYLAQFNMINDTEAVDACWKKIKRSLHGIRVKKNVEYFTSMMKLQPPEECHITDLDNTCEKCFHFKQMIKFVFMM